jgi:hypothetical protein
MKVIVIRKHRYPATSKKIDTTFVKVRQWWAKGNTNKVMTRRVEKISTMGWINVKENARNNNSLLLQ